MNKETALKILELDKGASFDEIRIQYRDLVSIWHPDRHINNERLRKKAEDKIKEINAAFDFLKRNYLDEKNKSPTTSTNQSSSTDKNRIITCEHCGSKNIYNGFELSVNPICKTCKRHVKKVNPENRTPCGDNKCTGIINENGRCGYCGKTLAEGKEENIRRHNKHEDYFASAHKQKKERPYGWVFFLILIGIFFSVSYFDNQTTNTNNSVSKRTDKERDNYIDIRSANPFSGNLNVNSSELDKAITDKFINEFNYTRDECIQIQKCLNTLGFSVGNPDGIIGKDSKKSLNQLVQVFGIPISDIDSDNFLRFLKHNVVIATFHPDWRRIYQDPNGINKWINSLGNKQKTSINNLLLKSNPIKISTLLNQYKFYRDAPSPVYRPTTGVIYSNGNECVAPLRISTRNSDIDYYVKLVEPGSLFPDLTLYIRGGDHIETNVPLGKFELKYAVGKTWYGEQYLFGKQTQYSKTEKIFDFKIVGNQISGYTVELYLQSHGNLRTKGISMYDF